MKSHQENFLSKELIFIRHAPVVDSARLCGRTDVAARVVDRDILAVRRYLPTPTSVLVSPALRCRQTAQALFPRNRAFEQDADLWEQDFGEHDGLEFQKIPDIGVLPTDELVAYAPPGGESFADVCNRVWPRLNRIAQQSAGQETVLVVHAGVIRAALAWVLGSAQAGMAFEIAPLSVTRLRVDQGKPMSVACVNFRCDGCL